VATVVAYIDGFNLYYGMKKKYGRKFLWLDVVDLARRLRPNDQLAQVRYFSAIVKNEPAAAQRQEDYMSALRARNGDLVEMHLGRFKDRTISRCWVCRQPFRCACGRRYHSWEEKETDVAMGAMMVADAAQAVADTTLLISADTDLAPALAAVRRVAVRQRIFLALPPGNTGVSRHLVGGGNIGHFFIRESVLNRAQMPDVVTDPRDGCVFRRPDKWR
jgi:uncharacterized LabA/DUF88 family protein